MGEKTQSQKMTKQTECYQILTKEKEKSALERVRGMFVWYLRHFCRFALHVLAGWWVITVNIKMKLWDAIRLASICIIESCHLERLMRTQAGALVTKPVALRFLLPRCEGMTNDERGPVKSTKGRDE